MKKLSEYKDEESIEILADILDPVATIASDKDLVDDIRKNFSKGNQRIRIISRALKTHKREVFEILAALERVPVEEYHCNMGTLPAQILNILNDKDLMSYFLSSVETEDETSSGSATENTEENEK